MKLAFLAGSVASVLVCLPAQAARIVVLIDAAAVGDITYYTMDSFEPTVKPYAQNFSFTVDASNLMIGQSTVFYHGPNSNAGVATGTITRIGGSEESQLFAGTNFTFGQAVLSNGGRDLRDTVLKAPTFDVRQVFPAPVPEPATWALMILGFGAVGYTMRRKQAAEHFA